MERDGGHLILMSEHGSQDLAGPHVPQSHALVAMARYVARARARCEEFAIRAEGHTPKGFFVAGQGSLEIPGFHIPQPHGQVLAPS